MDLPHLNVLTKIDKVSSYGRLPFNLDFYTQVQDLNYLLPHLEEESTIMRNPKFQGLNQAIIELVDGFGLVGFETLAVEDKRSMMHLLQMIDKAGGYAFGGAEGANDTVWQVAMRSGSTAMDIGDVQERWLDHKELYDDFETQKWEEEAKARVEAEKLQSNGAEDDDLENMSLLPGGSGITIERKNP